MSGLRRIGNGSPLHAPPHLVSGPAAPTVAHSLISSSTDSGEAGGAPAAPGTAGSESKMGLFTRESPNQEFSQQQLDSPPLSPTPATAPVSVPVPVPTSATSAPEPAPERGMGDGAAAATTSASPVAMLSSSPPPLLPASPLSRSDGDSSEVQVQPEEEAGDAITATAKKASVTPLVAD